MDNESILVEKLSAATDAPTGHAVPAAPHLFSPQAPLPSSTPVATAASGLSHPTAPTPDTPPVAPSALPKRRHVGKIARLPVELRNLVNNALREGRRYREIAALLEAQGCPDISLHNICRWARGGYRDWLQLQERFDSSSRLSPRLQALLGQIQPNGHSTLVDLNESILVACFHELLAAFDPSGLSGKSEDFLRLSKAFSAYLAARAQRQRADLHRLSYQLELRKLEHQKKPCKPGGLSEATIRLLEEKGKIL